VKCADCKFFKPRRIRGYEGSFPGVCTMQLPWWYMVHAEEKVVRDGYGCDLGQPKETG
jgi:hypothetical protein